MYQRVDEEIDGDTEFEGYSYKNKLGDIEKVDIRMSWCGVVDIIIDDESLGVYVEDIPKLIKALEAAKKYMES